MVWICGITNEKDLITVQFFKAHGGGYESDSDDEDMERERLFKKHILQNHMNQIV